MIASAAQAALREDPQAVQATDRQVDFESLAAAMNSQGSRTLHWATAVVATLRFAACADLAPAAGRGAERQEM
jgi:hypothetical protein